MRRFSFVLLLIALVLQTVGAQTPAPKIVAIRAGHLVDVANGRVLEKQLIVIEGDRIKSVGPDGKVPDGATLIDLSNSWVLPGLIDAHVHLTNPVGGNYYENIFRRSFVDDAVTAHLNAKATLEAGFTTVRNLGADAFVDVALRDAINLGRIPGPRMQVSAFNLAATGNSASSSNVDDMSGFAPWLGSRAPADFSKVADGPDELRQKVRYLVKHGAEVIKFRASGGVLSEEENVGGPKYSQAEMNAIVEEAKLLGVKVAAHAHGTEAIKMAVRAGVTSVEHGSFLDDEGIAMMKERGTYLVADIYNDDYILAEFGKLGYPDTIIEKERLVGRTQRENFRKALLAGVKIAYGTDAGVYPHGWNAKQFAKMVEWGQTPMQAIRTATLANAELLGWSDRVGSIAPGKFADMVAVSSDPLAKIEALESVVFVMKGGVVYRK